MTDETIEADLREKKVVEDILHLKFWIPSENEVAEIDVSANKLHNDAWKDEARKHLRRMYRDGENMDVAEEEKLEF